MLESDVGSSEGAFEVVLVVAVEVGSGVGFASFTASRLRDTGFGGGIAGPVSTAKRVSAAITRTGTTQHTKTDTEIEGLCFALFSIVEIDDPNSEFPALLAILQICWSSSMAYPAAR